MKTGISLLIFFYSLAAFAQVNDVWRPVSKETQAYHEYRLKVTAPRFGLKKVKDLIDKIEADDQDNEALPKIMYESLSLREKFTYNMIHAELYLRNSAVMLPVEKEEQKIFAYLPNMFDDYSWSDRQLTFLKANRDSVMALLKESIAGSKRVGVNYKHAIVEINAIEMIPFLVNIYRGIKKDSDILTVLMLLMKENEYGPFIRSPSHRKLYSDETYFKSYLEFNKANEDLVIKRAMTFYDAVKNKTGS